jgi:hypothetical protein
MTKRTINKQLHKLGLTYYKTRSEAIVLISELFGDLNHRFVPYETNVRETFDTEHGHLVISWYRREESGNYEMTAYLS